MIFRSLSLQGFRRYTNKDFTFGSGFNVIVGPNESGKTTLHQAIVTALYGFGSQAEQLLKSNKQVKNWYHPVDSQLSLEFEIGLERYLLKRDLDNGSCYLYRFLKESDSYETLTADRQKIIAFLVENLGIPSADVFNQSISVQQGQVSRLDRWDKVGLAVEEVFTGRERQSIKSVMDRLNEVRKSLKKERNEKPGQIDILQEELKECREKLIKLRQQHEEKLKVQEQVKQIGGSLPESKARLQELQQLTARFEAKRDKEKRLESLHKRYEELSKRLKAVSAQRQSLKSVKDRWRKLSQWEPYEESFEDLLLTVRSIEKVSRKIEEEEKRASLESSKEKMVIVHSDGWFYAPGAIWMALGVGVVSILLAVFWVWWFLGLTVFCIGWAVAIFKHGVVDQFNVTDIKSEYYQELLQEKNQELKEAESLIAGLDLDHDLLLDAEKLRQFMQEYYQAKEEWRQKTATVEILQQSEDYDGMEAEKEELGFSLMSIKKELEIDKDFHPTTQEVDRWLQEIKKIEKKLPFEEQQWNLAQGRVEQMNLQDEGYEDIEAQCDYINNQIARLEKRQQAVKIATEVMQEVVSNYRYQSLPVLQERSSGYVQQIMGDEVEVVLEESWPDFFLKKGGRDIEPADLSQGSFDQLFFALRLAAADVMSRQEPLPLLLDDPFVNFDDDRYEGVLEVLLQVARDRQVMYFTCRSHVPNLLKEMVYEEGEVKTIWLS